MTLHIPIMYRTPGADEIELTIDGEAIMRYADGEGGPLVPGICTYIPDGVPHGNHHPGYEDLTLLVIYPCPISSVGRADHKIDEPYIGEKKHTMINFLEAPAEEVAPGHFVTKITDGTGICAAYHRLAPGCAVRLRISSATTPTKQSLYSAAAELLHIPTKHIP